MDDVMGAVVLLAGFLLFAMFFSYLQVSREEEKRKKSLTGATESDYENLYVR